jgi:hypothetical protein
MTSTTPRPLLCNGWSRQETTQKYRGKGNNGIKKKQFADEICKLLASKGVRKERSAKDVVNKIASIADQFKIANDFALLDTGAGLKESDPEGSFKEAEEKNVRGTSI